MSSIIFINASKFLVLLLLDELALKKLELRMFLKLHTILSQYKPFITTTEYLQTSLLSFFTL